MEISQKTSKFTLITTGIKKCEEHLHTLSRPSPVHFLGCSSLKKCKNIREVTCNPQSETVIKFLFDASRCDFGRG